MQNWIFPGFFAAGVLLVLGMFMVWVRKRQDADRVERERYEQAVRDAIERQALLPDGRPACLVCKNTEATEAWPVVDTSWLDKVTAFKELYALTPRYEIRDGEGERYQLLLCSPHKRMCVQKWREVVATQRTILQQMISRVEAEIAQLQGGAMLAWLQQEHEVSAARLRDFMGVSPAPRLLAPGDDGPISMPSMSTTNNAEEREP